MNHSLESFAAIGFAALILFAGLALAHAGSIGFEVVKIGNDADAPLTVGIWYPTNVPAVQQELGTFTQNVASDAPVVGRRLPLVVLSHGGAGSYESHYDTALALAHAGFVAAAVSHAGDTFDGQSQVLRLWRRPEQLRRLLSYMLEKWPRHDQLDAARVGAFGFSNGGFTVLVAAGAVPNLDRTAVYCRAHPDHELCMDLRQANVDLHLGADVPRGAWLKDPRIKAVVVAAPAWGFAFGRAGLQGVHIPVLLWRAAEDRHQPNPWYDEAVRLALPRAPQYHVVAGAGHYAFLPPCGPSLSARMPRICTDPPGFDRAAFHLKFNAEIVRFFQMNLH